MEIHFMDFLDRSNLQVGHLKLNFDTPPWLNGNCKEAFQVTKSFISVGKKKEKSDVFLKFLASF